MPNAAGAPGPADPLAKFVVETAGASGGLCALPRCGEPVLPLSLASAGKYLVHVGHTDEKIVRQIADAAIAQKVIGRGIVVEKAPLGRLVFADNCVNVVVLADVAATDLKTLSVAEILRVLVPHGKAIVGRAKAAGAGDLTSQQLLAWAKVASPEAAAVDNDLGAWVVITKPTLAGSDNWSHWNHGPDNNPVSTDTARTWPSMVQWFGRPYNRQREGFLLVAGGRTFTADEPTPGYARPESPPGEVFAGDMLVARDAYNGRVLWSRKLENAPPYLLPVWIATDDRFYMTDTGTVVAIDAATGKDARRISIGAEKQEIRWMAMVDQTLYALLRDKPPATKTRGQRASDLEAAMQGTVIVAWDLKTDKEIWRQTMTSPVDGRAVAISGGKLFAYGPGGKLTALDAANGNVLWTFDDAKLLGEMNTLLTANALDGITLYRAGLVASPKAVVVNLNSRQSRTVFDAATGKVLWDSKLTGGNGGRGGHMMILDDRLLAKGMPGKIRELIGGKEIAAPTSLGGGCGRFTAGPAGILGMLSDFSAFDPKLGGERSLAKPDCHTGTILANGLTFTPPGACRCAMSLRGFLVETGRAQLVSINDSDRLETFAAAGAASGAASGAATGQDWPAHRGGDQHSGATTVSIGTGALSSKWTSEPTGAQPTPPIAVGERIFVAGEDGVIRCLDAASGKERWHYATAGKVRVAPTYWEGRIYAGSADGYVYCISAESGQPLWRFCAAAAQRRIMIMDGLSSAWPVNSGVLVRDGVAFAVAGFSDREGVHVWALDAKTGQIRWYNDKLAAEGMMPMGGMTVAGKYLWLRTDGGMPALDLKTGELAAPPKLKPGKRGDLAPSVRGGEIGVLEGRFIIQGGFRQFSDQWERTLGRGHNFGLIELDANGGGKYPMVRPMGECVLMPVWDSKLMLIPREQFRKAKKLEAWDTAKLVSWAAEERTKAEPGLAKMNFAEIDPPAIKSPDPVWAPIDHDINAAALAPDVIALAEGTHAKSPWVPDGWQVSTLDRDGKSLWQTKLPAEPVYDGLCVDRAGRIIVALADGSVACFGR